MTHRVEARAGGASGSLDGDERHVARAVGTSVVSQVAAKIVHLLLNVVSTLVVIRALTPAVFGDYVLVITLVTLFGLLGDFGLRQLAVRDVADDVVDEGRMIGTIIVARLALAVVAMAGVQLTLLALGAPGAVHVAGAVASTLILVEAFLAFLVAFHVRVQQQYEAYVLVAGEAVETALVVGLVIVSAPLWALVGAPAVGATVAVVLAGLIARRRYRLHLEVELARIPRVLRVALPIALSGIIGVVVFRLDTLMLAALRPREDVGLYGAAFTPIEYAVVGSSVLIGVGLPLLARYRLRDAGRYLAVYRAGSSAVVGTALVLPLTLLVLAEPVVRLAYGANYLDSAVLLQILGVGFVLLTVAIWQSFVLLAADLQRLTVRYNVAALLIAASLNVALIPRFGALGAAYATVLTSTFTATASTIVVVRRLDVLPDLGRLARIVIAAALAALIGVASLRLGLSPWVAAPLVLLAYALALRGSGLRPDLALASFLGRPDPSGDTPAPVPDVTIALPATPPPTGAVPTDTSPSRKPDHDHA